MGPQAGRRVLTLQTIPAREKTVPPGGQVSLTLKNTCNRIAKLVFVETGALETVIRRQPQNASLANRPNLGR